VTVVVKERVGLLGDQREWSITLEKRRKQRRRREKSSTSQLKTGQKRLGTRETNKKGIRGDFYAGRICYRPQKSKGKHAE